MPQPWHRWSTVTDWSRLDLDDHETIIAVVAEEESDGRSSPEEGEEQPVIQVQQCECDACERGLDGLCKNELGDSGLCYDCDDPECNGGCTL